MHNPTDRIAHTTAFVIPDVEHWLEREIAQWVHTMKDRSDHPSHYSFNTYYLFLFLFLFFNTFINNGNKRLKRTCVTSQSGGKQIKQCNIKWVN